MAVFQPISAALWSILLPCIPLNSSPIVRVSSPIGGFYVTFRNIDPESREPSRRCHAPTATGSD